MSRAALTFNFSPDAHQGFLFDCDGTLADSMPHHYEAWHLALEEAGCHEPFTEALFYTLGGVHSRVIVARLNEQFGFHMDPNLVASRKEALFLERVDRIQPIPEVATLARDLHSRGKPCAVVSGGLRHIVTRTLEVIGLLDCFPVIVTPEDVIHGKPAPDMFLRAAELLDVPPHLCVVFEDGPPGIEGAISAGMATVRIPVVYSDGTVVGEE